MAIKRPEFDNNKVNIKTSSDYQSTKDYEKGFVPDTLIEAEQVNSVLREFSLLAGAIETYALSNSSLGIGDDASSWNDDYTSGMKTQLDTTIQSDFELKVNNDDTNKKTQFAWILKNATPTYLDVKYSQQAVQLVNSRSLKVNLASSDSGSFNGTKDVAIGVEGTLPVSKGGTGQTNLDNVTVGKAKKIDSTGIGSSSKPIYVDSDGSLKESTPSLFEVTNSTYATKIGKSTSHPQIGSDTKGVYVDSNGDLKSCSYSVNKDVPSTAVFTDTTYSNGTGLNLTNNAFSVKYGTEEGTACQGNDSRLSDSRNAKDVYSWAKASTKPSYNYTEVGAKAWYEHYIVKKFISKDTGYITGYLNFTVINDNNNTDNYYGVFKDKLTAVLPANGQVFIPIWNDDYGKSPYIYHITGVQYVSATNINLYGIRYVVDQNKGVMPYAQYAQTPASFNFVVSLLDLLNNLNYQIQDVSITNDKILSY